MKAIILAAGQGTRLRPYTDSIPKTMVPVAGKSILEWQLTSLKDAGINDLYLVGGYKFDEIQIDGLQKFYNPAYDITNMVASLACARTLFDGSDDILICYGDIAYQKNLPLSLIQDNSDISMIVDKKWLKLWSLRMEDPMSDAESLKMDQQGYITELGKEIQDPKDAEAQYIGLIKVKASAAKSFFSLYDTLRNSKEEFDGQDFKNMYMTTYIQKLIDSGLKIKAVEVEGGWFEVDTTEDLEIYNDLISKGEFKTICDIF